jgi:flagellar hook-associated protein 3 FlgL
MRVTHKQMADAVAYNIFRQAERLLKAQETVSSQKRINRPSDDPIGMGKVLDYGKTLSSIEQYNTNIIRGKTRLDLAETALTRVYELLNEAKNIAINESAGVLDTRSGAAEEVKGIYDQILQLANTKVGANYIFAGHQTDTAPFSRDSNYNATYNGDSGDIRLIIGEGVDISINADGNETFTGSTLPAGVNIFDTLRDLIDGLENADTAAGTTQIANQVTPLQTAVDQILDVRATGAITAVRLETTENQLARLKLKVEDMLSSVEDVDLAQAIIDLQLQETAYQTALQTGARVFQPSLINFLS